MGFVLIRTLYSVFACLLLFTDDSRQLALNLFNRLRALRSMCNVILNSGERLWKPQSGDACDARDASVPFVIYVSKNRCALIGRQR